MRYIALITCLIIFASCKDGKANVNLESNVREQQHEETDSLKNDQAVEDCSDKPCCKRGDCEIISPNGGTLMKLGGDAAVMEIVIDHKDGAMAVYFYDGLAKEQLKLEQTQLALNIKTMNISLKADEKGVFRLKSDVIKGLKKFEATVDKLEIDGLPFDGVPVFYPEGN